MNSGHVSRNQEGEDSSFLNNSRRQRVLETPEKSDPGFSLNVLEVNPRQVNEEDSNADIEESDSDEELEQQSIKHPDDAAAEKFTEFVCQFLRILRLDQRIFRRELEPNDQKNLEIWQQASEKLLENLDLISQSPHLTIFLYFMMSVDEKELFSLLQLFTWKFDTSQVYMLNYDQFKIMMETMAKRHGVELMTEYFRYLDRYNFQQALQKDRFFSVASAKVQYFGPFILQGIFEQFQGDYPVDTSSGVEYYTDFWKMLPFNLTMMLSYIFKKSFKLRDRYHVNTVSDDRKCWE